MKIKMSTLDELCASHFKSFQDLGRDTVDITRDYYWTIDIKQLYDLQKKPSEFGLGSFIEEWEDMELIMKGEFVPSPVSLQWLAGLLLAAAEVLNASKAQQDKEAP